MRTFICISLVLINDELAKTYSWHVNSHVGSVIPIILLSSFLMAVIQDIKEIWERR